MHITQTLRRAVQTRGDATATVCGDRRRSWREVADRVARLAGAVQALGVQRGDRVAILSLNSDRYIEYLYAVAWAGAAANPVNIRIAPGEIAYTLEDSGSRVLFVDDTFAPMLPALREQVSALEQVIFCGDGELPEGTQGFEALIAAHGPVPDADAGEEDLAGLFYTGGTTGKAKGVMLSHDNVMHNMLNAIPILGYDASTVYLHAGPMFHLADMASTFAVTAAGGVHCVIPRFDIEPLLEIMQREKVTHTMLVPTMINMLLASGRIQEFDLSSLRRMLYGASPMPEAVLLRAMEALPTTGFTQGYGQTEAAPLITFMPPEAHYAGSDKLASAGVPGYSVDVAIMDEDGTALPNGQVGEVCARGGNIMQGYWKRAEQTAATLRDGWLRTGDLGYMDDDGFVFIVDRAKDMIISGGENVFSVEVEGAIYQHPDVQETAVIGVPSERWGEAVHAVVVPKAGATPTEQAIIEHCRGVIADYKLPRSVEIRSEPLPVSGAGKILKTTLRDDWGTRNGA
jgi:long-chain acyl-CoA synthetase